MRLKQLKSLSDIFWESRPPINGTTRIELSNVCPIQIFNFEWINSLALELLIQKFWTISRNVSNFFRRARGALSIPFAIRSAFTQVGSISNYLIIFMNHKLWLIKNALWPFKARESIWSWRDASLDPRNPMPNWCTTVEDTWKAGNEPECKVNTLEDFGRADLKVNTKLADSI